MDNDQRLENFRKMAEADPENELAHYSLGKLYFETGLYDDAEASLRRVLELNPRHSLAHRYLGETLLKRGETDAATEILRAGVLLAHEKGEYMPRNQMQDLLKAQGVEPPELPRSEASAEAEAGAAGSAEFVCRRCGQARPSLGSMPFNNPLGEQIHATICQVCWREWIEVSVKVINELRLNLMSSKDSEIYDEHMKEFLGL